MKKVLLTMLGVLIALPGIARDFSYTYEGKTLTYTVIDENAKTCKTKDGSWNGWYDVTPGNNVWGELIIPEIAMDGDTGYTVTSLGKYAFSNCSGLTSVTIPNSVTSIGGSAFDYCRSLTSVTIPNSVTTIGNYAFGYCSSLKKSCYPNTLSNPFNDGIAISYPAEGAEIEDGIVYGPNKSAIYFVPLDFEGKYTIPNTVTKIGNYAFGDCSSLTSVFIPNSVTTIGDKAFSNCHSLKKSCYPNTLSNPFSDGITISYPAEGAEIEDGIVYGPNKSAIYFVPLDFEGKYTIPNTVTKIGNYAFGDCSSVTSVIAMVGTPPEMRDNSFDGFYAAVLLSVPDDAVSAYLATNWSLFENIRCSNSEELLKTFETGNLKYRLIPDLTNADKNLAVVIPGEYSNLTEVTVPERITYSDNGSNDRYYVDAIGYKAFKGCSNLATVTFNSRNAARTIGEYAFAGTNISAITMPETIESIGDYAFSECSSLSSIEIPGSVRTIGDYAFYKTQNLGKVTFNEGLESIGERAFSASSDRNVEPIYIPSTLKSVGENAFYNFNCQYVNISDLASWCNIDFGNSDSNPAIHGKKLYLNGEMIENLVIPESINEVKDYTFCNNSNLQSVTFNDALQIIGISAFEGCYRLASPIFNEGLQSIGDKAFYGCNAITSLILPNSLRTIGQQAFYGEKSMKNLTIGTSLTECNADSFEGCKFDDLIITDGLTKLRFGGRWDKIGIHNLYMGRPIEF